jgi:hypothetical protein
MNTVLFVGLDTKANNNAQGNEICFKFFIKSTDFTQHILNKEAQT